MAAWAGGPGVVQVQAPVPDGQFCVFDGGGGGGGQMQWQGAGVDVWLVGGHEPAAECEQVPQEVGYLAGQDVAPGMLEVQSACAGGAVGDVGLGRVALGEGGGPLAVGVERATGGVDRGGHVE